MTIEGSFLPECTARILVKDALNGTGFFVTSKDVVTCQHVAYDASAIKVLDLHQVPHAVQEVVVDKDVDLAWIKLENADPQIPVALLGENFNPGDDLFSFGYPGGTNGEPAIFKTEGWTGDDPPRIKFSEGQVKLGASGSPLLNGRTGAVCAILGSTRNKTLDLGGYGILVSTLLSRPAFFPLRQLNSEAHASDARWVDALTPMQRALSRSARPAAGGKTIGLVIDVAQRSDGWWVSAQWLPEGRSCQPQPVDLNVVRSKVARLFRAWRSQQRIDESEQARTLGEVLYRSIFPKDLAAEFERRTNESSTIDVSLHFEESVDRDLRYLPWEQLYTPDSATRNQIPLGSDAKMTLGRVLATDPVEPPQPTRAYLNLLVIAAPMRVGDQPLQCAEDVRDGVLGMTDIAHFTVSNGQIPELGGISEKLGDSVDVLHYVGYGLFGATSDRIAVSGRYGQLEYASPEDFADCLAESPPRLLVLQTCLGPQGPGQIPGDLTELAVPILKAGVAAVVVFQFPLSGRDAAKIFNRVFYRELMAASTVRTAVQKARSALASSKYRWDLPALFERQPRSSSLVSGDQQTTPLAAGIWRSSP
jgi:Trypsin-like peptidase domain/CHAT domain